MEFNEDGSLKIGKNFHNSESAESSDFFEEEKPSLLVLKLLSEVSFPIGRKLISETLRGENNLKLKKLRLNLCEMFGALDLYSDRDIYRLIDDLAFDGFVEITKTRYSKFYPVVIITDKGKKELENPSLVSKDGEKYISMNKSETMVPPSPVTEEDKRLFSAFGDFLSGYNEEQKKAIIESGKRILCIAGAGSGKTSVLSKRIEFLVRLKGVDPKKILAITFTRKARQEMISRIGIPEVSIETFNSFCEKFLRKNEKQLFPENYSVIDFRRKISLFNEALSRLKYTPEMAIDKYFNSKRGKDEKTLFLNLMNDVFSLIDHYKNSQRDLSLFKEAIIRKSPLKDQHVALFIYNLILEVEDLKKKYYLRDYADQLVHAVKIFKEVPTLVPNYEHILVDEYQDVNDIQVTLLSLLNPENLFVVGDPRQSIYGWRGSKIKNIINFPVVNKNSIVIQLSKNYRSSSVIVDASNEIISSLGFPNIHSADDDSSDSKDVLPDASDISILDLPDENTEYTFVAQSILSLDVPREEVFVLARTNKQVDSVAEIFANFGIDYLARKGDNGAGSSSDKQGEGEKKKGKVVVSTVHAIKGMEADVVYLVGVNTKMYPCLVSEHPVQDLAKIDFEYDKMDEELRLLYVALTRARKKIVITHTGSLTKFINSRFRKIIEADVTSNKNIVDDTLSRLKEWRDVIARKKDVLPFMVLPDKVLHQIAYRKPCTVLETKDLLGYRMVEYSEEIFSLVNER